MRKQILFCLILSLTLMACSRGFETQQREFASTSSKTAQDAVDVTPDNGEDDQGENPSTNPPLIAEKFSLKENGFVDGLTTQYEGVFETTLEIPYGIVYDALSLATKFVAPYACQWRGVQYEQNPAAVYSRNEIPCGKLMSNGYKQVTVIDIPETRKENGSSMASLSAVQIPIWVSRFQYSGVYQEHRLDSGTVENINSSPNFGDDISIRYEPGDMTGKIHICAALPGVEVTTPGQTVKAKASYKALGIKVSEVTKFEVEFGKAKFDYVRGCLATEIKFTGDQFIPEFKLQVTEKPKVAGATHWGLKIETTSWWQKMLDEVFSWFRASLLDRVTKLANREVNKYIENDLKTGEWFSKAQGEEALDDISRQINQSVVRVMRNTGLPLSTTEMRRYLNRQCDLLPFLKNFPIQAREVCRRAVESVNIGFIPFYRNETMQARGCYSGYANIHQTRTNGDYKTWAKECKFSMKLQVQVRAGLTEQEKQMLETLLASFKNLETWTSVVRQELNLSEEHEQILLLVLNEASKREEKLNNLNDILKALQKYAPMVQSQFYSWLASDLNINVPL